MALVPSNGTFSLPGEHAARAQGEHGAFLLASPANGAVAPQASSELQCAPYVGHKRIFERIEEDRSFMSYARVNRGLLPCPYQVCLSVALYPSPQTSVLCAAFSYGSYHKGDSDASRPGSYGALDCAIVLFSFLTLLASNPQRSRTDMSISPSSPTERCCLTCPVTTQMIAFILWATRSVLHFFPHPCCVCKMRRD
jgi:hypothetical protein